MSRYLTFLVKGKRFALPVEWVKEILPIRSVVDLPVSNPWIRGGINIRGNVLTLFDFRLIMGESTLIKEREELVVTLNQREQDHIDWLDALKKSVTDGSEFRKATNPKACAFGKWYYTFKAPDSTIERTLADFEEPHNEIHALAHTALSLSNSGKREEAIKLVEEAKTTTLSRLLKLFTDLKSSLTVDIRELAIVCLYPNGKPFAVAVDGVENIRSLENEKFNVRDAVEASTTVVKIWSTDTQTALEVDFRILQKVITQMSSESEVVTENQA